LFCQIKKNNFPNTFVPLLGQQILPLQALDAHSALLRGPVEAHHAQPPGHVSVHEAVSEVPIQRRLDVLALTFNCHLNHNNAKPQALCSAPF
uniref:Uncharacterized protein n=1 Tax=Oryzias melastigma TaxID=30732 RepID=A0A3B3DCK1_ORYME